MNSQNRMNAGAEYVLYRIWATLQDSERIHAESLFACLGALSGYACQLYAREAGARARATQLEGDVVNRPLVDSPLSVWALVGRAVHKAGRPLPDIAGILAYATRTVGTGAFGVPRVSDEHRPHHHAVVYLRQLWPQILPIARRFCRKPAQLPVLFGIALQRAIEHTAGFLNPTLSASIAMECAVAMSRAALPELATAEPIVPAPAIVSSPKPTLALPTAIYVDSATANARRSTSGRRTRAAGTNTVATGSSWRMPAPKVFATAASLAIIAIGSAMWRTDPGTTPASAPRIERKLRVSAFQGDVSPTLTQPTEDAPPPAEESIENESAAPPLPIAAEDSDLPAAAPEQPSNEGIITEDP